MTDTLKKYALTILNDDHTQNLVDDEYAKHITELTEKDELNEVEQYNLDKIVAGGHERFPEKAIELNCIAEVLMATDRVKSRNSMDDFCMDLSHVIPIPQVIMMYIYIEEIEKLQKGQINLNIMHAICGVEINHLMFFMSWAGFKDIVEVKRVPQANGDKHLEFYTKGSLGKVVQ